jgi:hypothetical protein
MTSFVRYKQCTIDDLVRTITLAFKALRPTIPIPLSHGSRASPYGPDPTGLLGR